ncbi:alpha/beta fold hydrolase [Pseudolysinimonas kribbensis]|nr:alpha/beta fold hydrolase [Pseudolysinimonas kribbensis]
MQRDRRRRLADVHDGLRALRLELARLNHRVSDRLELRDLDLDCFDLVARSGSLTPTELAGLSGIHPATLTGILDRLERGGWIVRERAAGDRRSVRLRPAPRSAAQIVPHFAGMNDAMDAACADFSDEQLDLIAEFLRRATVAGERPRTPYRVAPMRLRRSNARRLTALVAVMTATTLLLSGCILQKLPVPGSTHTVTTHTHEAVAPDLERFYTQGLRWRSVSGGIDTTEVTVPLDWAKPSGATIELAIARHRAKGSRLGSLLINPGGPGGSGYDFVAQSAQFVVTPDVLGHYDLIGFDPRGVGRSTPVACYTDPKKQDALLYQPFVHPFGSAEWAGELSARQKDWIAACRRNTGPLLGHLDAASVARDMDVIRAVLGDTRMHYLGYSYGTYLGTMYAQLFPKKVGRMVLDGAVDPRADQLDALVTQMAGFDSAFKAYLANCLTRSGCPFSGSLDHAIQQVQALLAGVDARHLVASDGRVLDAATVGTAISEPLYSEFSWPDLTEMFARLAKGDSDPAFEQADAYNNRTASGGYSTNGYEIYTAVTCDETTLGTDGVDILTDMARIEKAAPVLGKYVAYSDTAALEATCDAWPYPPAKLPASYTAPGSPPIVVIGTTNDPATPYQQSVTLAKELSQGFLFTHHGEGHTVYAQGDACIDSHVDDYLLRGALPASDPDCH